MSPNAGGGGEVSAMSTAVHAHGDQTYFGVLSLYLTSVVTGNTVTAKLNPKTQLELKFPNL